MKRRFKDILGLSISAGLAQIAAVVALPLLQRYCYGPVAFADMAAYAQLAGILGAVATLRMDLALVKQNSLENARATLSNGRQIGSRCQCGAYRAPVWTSKTALAKEIFNLLRPTSVRACSCFGNKMKEKSG